MDENRMASTAHPRPSLDERVRVAAYDPAWPGRAAEEIGRLRAALGNRVREVQHIGSTAVPGRVAKPIVDLQASVRNVASALALAPVLAPADLQLNAGRRRSRGAVGLASLKSLSCLALRDYLRAHPQEADYYGRQKREILAQGGSRLLVYSDAKAPLLRELVIKVRVRDEEVKSLRSTKAKPSTLEENCDKSRAAWGAARSRGKLATRPMKGTACS